MNAGEGALLEDESAGAKMACAHRLPHNRALNFNGTGLLGGMRNGRRRIEGEGELPEDEQEGVGRRAWAYRGLSLRKLGIY